PHRRIDRRLRLLHLAFARLARLRPLALFYLRSSLNPLLMPIRVCGVVLGKEPMCIFDRANFAHMAPYAVQPGAKAYSHIGMQSTDSSRVVASAYHSRGVEHRGLRRRRSADRHGERHEPVDAAARASL